MDSKEKARSSDRAASGEVELANSLHDNSTTNGDYSQELSPNHLAMLREGSGISDTVIQARGYRTITDKNDLTALGFSPKQCRLPGLLLPLWTTDGQNGLNVYRPDNPAVIEQRDKGKLPDGTYPCKVIKYETPKGSGIRLDCPPTCRPSIGDPTIPLWVTEGQKKADALASLGACALAMLGVWGFLGKNQAGGITWLADWEYIALKGREVRVVFDSDVMGKPQVAQALKRMTDHLTRKGATVQAVYLPTENGAKVGVDDWLVNGHTLRDLEALVETPRADLRGNGPAVTTADYINGLTSLGYFFRMNMCDDSIEVSGQKLSDPLRAKIRAQMRDLGFMGMPAMEDAYAADAFDRRYHPVHTYLQGLTWDETPHIAMLASYFQDRHQNNVFYTWLRRWLIGCIAKAYTGAQNPMLVLDGPQNCGKSYFAAWLASSLSSYFYEGPIDTNDKDAYVRLMSKWIWEVAELGATTRRSDREALKYFLSMETVTVRKPYGRLDTIKPALASFIGTVNNEHGILSDPTGSRRFLVVGLTEINWDYSKDIDIDQVWAEAYAAYRKGEPWRLTIEERELANVINDEYEIEDPVEDLLRLYHTIDPENKDAWSYSTDILETLEFHGLRGSSRRANSMALSSTMRRLKCESGRREGRRGYVGVTANEVGKVG